MTDMGERGGVVASYRGLPKGGRNEGEEKGCRKLSRAVTKWQGCSEFYYVMRDVLDCQKVARAGGGEGL